MCMYGTCAEATELSIINRRLPCYEIVDPSLIQKSADKDEGMRFFFRIIDNCDALIFSKLLGKITSGVGLEVNYALSRQIHVFELENGRVVSLTTPALYLSREETYKQYELWRGSC